MRVLVPGNCDQHGPWDGPQGRCPPCRRAEYERRIDSGAQARQGERATARRQADPELQAKLASRARARYWSDPEAWRTRNRAYTHEYRVRLRLQAIEMYGGKCACCGEAEEAFLCIDHVDGGGNAQRRLIRKSSMSMYQWLQRNAYPDGFQILCANCNTAKERPSGCPHQRRT